MAIKGFRNNIDMAVFQASFFASVIWVMELTLHKASFHLDVVNFSKVIGAQTNTPLKNYLLTLIHNIDKNDRLGYTITTYHFKNISLSV